jgi:hypothetical protein
VRQVVARAWSKSGPNDEWRLARKLNVTLELQSPVRLEHQNAPYLEFIHGSET